MGLMFLLGFFRKGFDVKYKIVEHTIISDLEKEVNEYLMLGWKCQGGGFVLNNYYHQAMILDEQETTSLEEIESHGHELIKPFGIDVCKKCGAQGHDLKYNCEGKKKNGGLQ